MEHIRDRKPKYQPEDQPSLESYETEISKRSISDFFLNKTQPWGYDKLGNTNLFDLLGAANTECLYTWEGHKVEIDQLKNKFVILHLLKDDVRNVEATCPGILFDMIETYQDYGRHSEKYELEIVFVWLGDDKDVFSNHFYMPWLAVSPKDEKTVNIFAKEFDFPAPVRFLLFDRNGSLFLHSACNNINSYGVLGFPFTHERMEEIDSDAAKLCSEIIDGKLVALPDILGTHVISPIGDEVPTSDLNDKTVGLYMLNPYPSRIVLEELKRICENKKDDFVLIPIITSYHSSWSRIRAGCSDLERSIPWYTLPDFKCRFLHKVFHNYLKDPYLSSGACDLVIFKADKHLPVSLFASHIFARFGVDAYPFTIEKAVQAEMKQQGDLVLKEILSSKSILRRQGSEQEEITVSDLDGKHVLLLFGTHGFKTESFVSTMKNLYVNKQRDNFEIIYIHVDFTSESTSFSSNIMKMPWVVHSSPELAVFLFECVFPMSAHLPAIAAFGVNGHLETKGSDLASNDKLVSLYPPFIQADMYDEVYQELKDEHGWNLENVFYSPEERETTALNFRQLRWEKLVQTW
ncbi:putative nucleoredoxin 1 isoform X1 [Apium graveolens]|uniref:putative nucleoredoxin 1 isoform X1 n=1 Tax=Apium graveolens TaxID=4045 RepID=UPI003D7C1287